MWPIMGVVTFGVGLWLGQSARAVGTEPAEETPIFSIVEENINQQSLTATLDGTAYERLVSGESGRRILVPVAGQTPLELQLERFSVIAPNAVFKRGHDDAVPSRVVLYRGTIAGESNSTAFLSVSSQGMVNGFAMQAGEQPVYLATPTETIRSGAPLVTVTVGDYGDMPDFAEFCATEIDLSRLSHLKSSSGVALTNPAGLRVATVGIEADRMFCNLFGGNAVATQDYIIQLLGAIATIYERDMSIHLQIGWLRTWPTGGEPFTADNLSGLRDYWNDNEDTTLVDLVHLLSGTRTTTYGGVAYLSGTCGNDFAYGIDGYMNGSFPTAYNESSLGNWDIIVWAHEMGHNFGTLHTHDIDQYDPLIDSCAQGFPSRGTIMSYCHSAPGYTLNTDMRFHQRVQATIINEMDLGGCHMYDCNGNGIADAVDIATVTSFDVNFDGIPDECQDCNGNSILDPVETAGGVNDVNGNTVPDQCEDDCNQNGVPDEYETQNGFTADTNGNGIPDSCEPDCNANAVADHTELSQNMALDLDRNLVLDECEDCNSNGVTDWKDLQGQYNAYVIDAGGFIREYHGASGVPVQNFTMPNATDLTVGPDRRLYIARQGSGSVAVLDPATGISSTFVSGGILTAPSALTFGPDDNLYVGNGPAGNVVKVNGVTGAPIGIFASGLSEPVDMEFGPNGHLYVLNGGTGLISELSGVDGSVVQLFGGSLVSPHGMAFRPNGNLLVTSTGSDRVIEFDNTGGLIGQFNDSTDCTEPWGIQRGPDGDFFVMRSAGTIRMLKYTKEEGRYDRAFVRNDPGLPSPTQFVFMPQSEFDCNANGQLDECDISQGLAVDSNLDGIPDNCTQCCIGATGNVDGDAGDVVNLTDLTQLINHLFVTFQPLDCPAEANTNGDAGMQVTLSDVTQLVNYLFVTFEPLADCL
jgi:sugar lactone lactonase YvrE